MDIIQTIGVTRSFPTPGGQPFMALKGIDMEGLKLEDIIKQALKKMVK